MPDQSIPAIRQHFLEDMRVKGLSPKTQAKYLRAMRNFTRFIGRSPDTASLEDLRAFQLNMADNGVGVPTFDNRLSVLSFFFSVTCAREGMKKYRFCRKHLSEQQTADHCTYFKWQPLKSIITFGLSRSMSKS